MIITEGLEDRINQILNDPESISQLMGMAKSLGLQEQQPSAPPSAPMDDGMLMGMMQLMQHAQQTDGRQEALLCALRPYLAPERQAKLDRAIQIAKMSSLAGIAMKSGLFGK